MKPEKQGKSSRVVWLLGGAAASVATSAAGGVAAFHITHRAEQAEAAFQEWVELRPRAEIAAGLIEGGVHTSKRKRARVYLLGMSNGTQIAGEADLYAVMAYFEVWGAIAARRC